uniref:Uncharacterized protein n=1 Tax=Anguilla anguilla TaxID=7936 RepID=A0A0E9U4H8_ANGAN
MDWPNECSGLHSVFLHNTSLLYKASVQWPAYVTCIRKCYFCFA